MVRASKERMAPGSKISLNLSILVYQEDGIWIAHCLELDVPAEGGAPADALKNVTDLIEFQVENALAEGDLQSIFSFAPPELWKTFAVAKEWPSRRQPKRVSKQPINRLQVRELSGREV